MCRKFGNCWMGYRDPIDLMDCPSNMEIDLHGYQKGANNKWTYNFTSFDGGFRNNNYISLYDKYYKPRCL